MPGRGGGRLTERHDDSAKTSESVHNEMGGNVYGPVIQARDIHSVHLHPPAPSPPRPNQLLPRPRLVGRESSIAALNVLRDQVTESPLTVLITGSAGVGKTALSLAWAHMIRTDYPDGQLYAALSGHADGDPVSPLMVLGDFLHALGIAPDLIPGDLARRAALYRTLTHDRRLLVLLDDAVTAAQVRPLLPTSPASIAVVTSRYRLAGLLAEGAFGMGLDRLDTSAGLALLAGALGEDRVAREREAATKLVELCMRLPLALRVAAARLAARPTWSLSEMVEALDEEQRRMATLAIGDDMAVQSALDLSYRALDRDVARLYRLLGLVPGDTVSGDAVAALAGIPRMEARRQLGLLTDANLLTDTAHGRYRFHHALIQLHASHLVEAEDPSEARDTAVARLLGWYLDTAAHTERRLRPYRTGLPRDAEPPPAEPTDFGGPADALAWLEVESGNLRAAVKAAQERNRPATAWQLADAMWPLFLFRGHHVERVVVEEIGLAAARTCGDRHAEAKMLNRLGLSLHGLGHHAEAAAHFTDARGLWRRLGERDREAGSLRRLALVAAAQDKRDEAIAQFLAAYEMYQDLGADRKAALALVDLADLLISDGRGLDAIVHLEQARDLIANVDDAYNRTRVLTMVGRARAVAGEVEAADRALRSALAGMTELGSSVGRAEALEALGELSERMGQPDQARDRFTEALAALGDTETTAHVRLRHHLGRLDPAC
jgi:tetratricopeptide (TPR) repeat protein